MEPTDKSTDSEIESGETTSSGAYRASEAARVFDRHSTSASAMATGYGEPSWTRLTAAALAVLARTTVGSIGGSPSSSFEAVKAGGIKFSAKIALALAGGLDHVAGMMRAVVEQGVAEFEKRVLESLIDADLRQSTSSDSRGEEGEEQNRRRLEAFATAFAELGRDAEAADAFYELGNLHHRFTRYPEALSAVQRALERNRDHVGALVIKAEVLRMLGDPGQYDEAIEVIEHALKLKPDNAWGHAIHGRLLSTVGRHDAAADALGRAVELDGNIDQWHFLRGDALRLAGRFDVSLASFDRALELSPGDTTTIARRADVLRMLGRFEDSLTEFDKALKANPDDTWSLASKGETLRCLGRLEDAETVLLRVVAQSQSYPFAEAALGHVWLKQERYREALTMFERALGHEAANEAALEGRLEALFKLDRIRDGLEAAQALLAFDPSSALGHGLAGALHYKAADYEAAIHAFQRSVEASSSIAWTQNALGMCCILQAKSKPEAAAQLLEQAVASARASIALDPEESSWHETLAQALWAAKGEQRREAYSEFEKVLEMARSNPKLDFYGALDGATAAWMLASAHTSNRELLAEAERLMLEALRQRSVWPTSIEGLDTKLALALIMLSSDRFSLAFRELDNALTLAAATHESVAYKGLVRRAQVRLADAREAWPKLKDSTPAIRIAQELELAYVSQAERQKGMREEAESMDVPA